jgi:hypothetical protein
VSGCTEENFTVALFDANAALCDLRDPLVELGVDKPDGVLN